ncbi:Rqc2 family fibronectin-binding protein [Heyndrickxia coagulans]|uniref:Rqc2 family fibronectin-binding protein n=1 Tax=Heyndrickxia coagulans TaxID=1398 RepID=UPI000E47696B|nr:NFACT RNA binding domain-containing protein [Heyndrickxia coagulans]RGR81490.1 fibronectin/fibrinogen-binding protein [Heyndrickxia coagulans]RGR95238.1 fibronectin/fibrinogen-binding protein [Heyndrickxia coagulans]
MSFDGLFTRAMVKELVDTIKGGRMNRIHQPYQNELVLIVRANGKNRRLLLSAHPAYARIQLTDEPFDNPQDPPMFCMLLRKHLEGSVIEDIRQAGLDRVVVFDIKSRNEIGDISYKQLYVEIMGRHSNIILVDKERNLIMDSIKHVPPAVNTYRTILPGHEYVMPPEQHKRNPLEATKEDVIAALDWNSGKMDKQIVAQFAGVSPLLAKEIMHRAKFSNPESVTDAFLSVMEPIKKFDLQPVMIMGAQKESFYMIPLTSLEGETKTFPTLSALLDRFYAGKAERDRVKQKGHDLERFVKNELEKNESKIKKLEATLEEAQNAEQFQLYGELLTANLYAVKKGMDKVKVQNYYDENGAMVEIPLDPLKTPAENAQSYFSRYQKAKHAQVAVREQIKKARDEVLYFENLLQQLETASPKDIGEIREELEEEGYLKKRHSRTRRKNANKIALEKYEASDGTEILVGKNNKQNDYLTNRVAARDEIWLHTKDIPGSHVVIRSKNPAPETILEAASLAAYFSKARQSASVPVDYTKVRYVKKPNGAKPGFVIYENQQTVYVTPDTDKVLAMKKTKDA